MAAGKRASGRSAGAWLAPVTPRQAALLALLDARRGEWVERRSLPPTLRGDAAHVARPLLASGLTEVGVLSSVRYRPTAYRIAAGCRRAGGAEGGGA